MNDLVYQGANNQVITTSLMVAEKFGKEHNKVIKRIDSLIEDAGMGVAKNGETLNMYEKTTYVNQQNGQEYPIYMMNRDGFTLLAMSFTGKEALKFKLDYINAFNQMENHIKEAQSQIVNVPQTFAQALMLAAKQQEALEEKQKLLVAKDLQIHEMTNIMTEMEKKVSYVDKILACKSTVTVTQIAQDYGMSAKAFNKLLSDLMIQYKVNDQWILYKKYMGGGYVHSKSVEFQRANGSWDVKYNTEWTQKGRLFLYEFLKKHNYLPLIEQ